LFIGGCDPAFRPNPVAHRVALALGTRPDRLLEHTMTADAGVEESRQESKAKVFISYSRKDMAFADRLEAALKTRGFEPLIVQQVVGYWKCCGPSSPLGRTAIEPTADLPRNCASA
jgi:hypothetical protein